jgi:hypothetical protein
MDRRVLRAMLVACAGCLAAMLPSAARAQQSYQCTDAYKSTNVSERLTVIPREYSVGLDSSSVQAVGVNIVRGRITVLLLRPRGSNYARAYYPVVAAGAGEVFVQCKEQIRPESFPTELTMTITGVERDLAPDLVTHLQKLGAGSTSSTVLRIEDVPWPSFLLFKRAQKRYPDKVVTRYEDLIESYLSDHEVAFLDGFQASVDLKSSNLPSFGFSTRPGVASGQANPANPAPAPTRPANANDSVRSARQGGAPATPPVGAPQPASKVFTLRFHNAGEWQAVLKEPGVIKTFDNGCSEPEEGRDGFYHLSCVPGADGKIAIQIRGFKTVVIDGTETALDDKLEVAGFSVPYPQSWRRSRTDLVEVTPGRLSAALRTPRPLSQGLEGVRDCDATIASISVRNIVDGTLPFPEPPCRPYQIRFPGVRLAPDAQITANCLPGSRVGVPIVNGQVTCWRGGASQARAGADTLTAHLLAGFMPTTLQILPNEAILDFSLESLANVLTPVWPYSSQPIQPGDAPHYSIRSIQFLDEGRQPCGGPVAPDTPVGAPPSVGTLQHAGCNQIPRQMTFTFEQDGRSNQGVGSAPAQAFVASYPTTVNIDAPTQPQIPLDQLKVQLPVNFPAEYAEAYSNEFGAAAGNTLYPGVYVFSGDCNGLRNGKYVPFRAPTGAAPSAPLTFKWPIKAAAYDGKSDDPLTRCAGATVGSGATGPYFTFMLDAARAYGPRRAIVISNSQKFSSQPGTPKALVDALQGFVDQISDAHNNKRAPLSPIEVYLVNGQSNYVRLFSGEMAAQEPDKVKHIITETQERLAPTTPEFGTLRLQPEVKDNFDRVLFVMDGSDVSQGNRDVLASLINTLNKTDKENVNLLITSNSCAQWQKETQNFNCKTLSPDLGERKAALSEAFAKFINQPGTSATVSAVPTPPSTGSRQSPGNGPPSPAHPGSTPGTGRGPR